MSEAGRASQSKRGATSKVDVASVSDDTKLQFLIAHFSDDQLSRYEQFRRASFMRSSIKKIISSTIGVVPNQNVVISISGITKLFVGEIVEEALGVRDSQGEAGPVRPIHIVEAFRRVRRKNRFIRSLSFANQ